jgi:glutamyl-tRNA synthetase
MKVITRFAPSPTGDLHLGSARTALFNYLFAKRHNGKFLLRIEDTDIERSTKESLNNILEGLEWLGLKYEGDLMYQSLRTQRYLDIAKKLVSLDKAYYCYTSKDEIENLRAQAKEKKETFIFQSPYRDIKKLPDHDAKPVIRLKSPRLGKTILNDIVQGRVEIENSTIEDTILVRSDGNPTYMLSVVVDDIDMGITHIIRGVDHLTNCFRQVLIYNALEVELPIFCHIPLIHGSDGAKMSKRHGATSLLEYKKLGYLPETMANYLLRLGWSHGDDEIINMDNAILWFDLEHIGKSSSKFDEKKLSHLNSYYLNIKSDEEIFDIIKTSLSQDIDSFSLSCVKKALKSIRERAKSITELIALASFYTKGFALEIDEPSKNILSSIDPSIISDLIEQIKNTENFDIDAIKNIIQNIAIKYELKLPLIMNPVRVLMTGQQNSPSIFEMISILGKEETIKRLQRINLIK